VTTHVEHCMGTTFMIDVRDGGRWDEAIDDVVEWLHHVDAVFSTYREHSDISRIRRGELRAEEADAAVGEVLSLCRQMRDETGGHFSAHWDGELDPTGLVKGWSIERASDILFSHGSRNHAVNGGGDLQLSGGPADGKPWRVGISDPSDQTRLLAVVEARDCAIATSGVAERGPHIVEPLSGMRADALSAVTVVGRSLTRVDSYATAAFAMGAEALAWLEAQPGHEGLVVDADGAATATSRFYAATSVASGIEITNLAPPAGARRTSALPSCA
jgi:FAD:protein FMN transferase